MSARTNLGMTVLKLTLSMTIHLIFKIQIWDKSYSLLT